MVKFTNILEVNSTKKLNMNFSSIEPYFTTDTQNRVKVTADIFNSLVANSSINDSPTNLALVSFKAGRIGMFSYEIANLEVGTLVIVDADRGKDLGAIVKLNCSLDEAKLLKLLHDQSASSTETSQVRSSISNILQFPRIVRIATSDCYEQILNKYVDEIDACQLFLAKVTGLPSPLSSPIHSNPDIKNIKLVDSEYQFDRRKLTFYFTCEKRIDFRNLVRDLFKIYKTRIWLSAVEGLPYVPKQLVSPLLSPTRNDIFGNLKLRRSTGDIGNAQAIQAILGENNSKYARRSTGDISLVNSTSYLSSPPTSQFDRQDSGQYQHQNHLQNQHSNQYPIQNQNQYQSQHQNQHQNQYQNHHQNYQPDQSQFLYQNQMFNHSRSQQQVSQNYRYLPSNQFENYNIQPQLKHFPQNNCSIQNSNQFKQEPSQEGLLQDLLQYQIQSSSQINNQPDQTIQQPIATSTKTFKIELDSPPTSEDQARIETKASENMWTPRSTSIWAPHNASVWSSKTSQVNQITPFLDESQVVGPKD